MGDVPFGPDDPLVLVPGLPDGLLMPLDGGAVMIGMGEPGDAILFGTGDPLEVAGLPVPLDRLQVRARIDALIDVVVGIYAPLPRRSLATTIGRLRYAVPQWRGELKAGLQRVPARLARCRVDGVDWFWPAGESTDGADPGETVRLLSPFDPVVWDRRRFELLWGWAYRFEAYTPAVKRKLGYYALPLLWRERVIGWANVSWRAGELVVDLDFVESRPVGHAFKRALDSELDRMRAFLAREESAPSVE